ncbi:RNA polymerase sigma factor [Bacillus phage Hoody T]|uniref:Sigma factor n=2 Tax=Bastillevirus TaxID=1918010 RepID=A0A143FJP7_9CAUD|nr:RNA polymerase sigma factor [Bacillus phage Hoody T]AHZ10517.1 RNA polymerase sigma factor [Bacillus phage Hoody T]AMW61966.1 sigma factor [Bacillus phage Vinny]
MKLKTDKIRNYDLIVRAQEGDEDAMNILLKKYKALIWSCVHAHDIWEANQEDAFQEGAKGFIKAVQRLDLEVGYELSTYAKKCVDGTIKNYLRDSRVMKVPPHVEKLARKLKAQEIIPSDIRVIADTYGVSYEDAREAIIYLNAGNILSMDMTIESGKSNNDGGVSIGAIMSNEYHEMSMDNKVCLRMLVDKLPANEKHVIARKYFDGAKNGELGKELGVHKNTVYNIEQDALRNLRRLMRDEDVQAPVRAKNGRGQVKNKGDRETAKKLLKEGNMSYVHISRETGVPEGTLSSWASKLKRGIEI